MSASRDKKTPANTLFDFENASKKTLLEGGGEIVKSNYGDVSGAKHLARFYDDAQAISATTEQFVIDSTPYIKGLIDDVAADSLDEYGNPTTLDPDVESALTTLDSLRTTKTPLFHVTENQDHVLDVELSTEFPRLLSKKTVEELKKYVLLYCKIMFDAALTKTGQIQPSIIDYLNNVPVTEGTFYEQLRKHYNDDVLKSCIFNAAGLLSDQATGDYIFKTTNKMGVPGFLNRLNICIREQVLPQYEAILIKQNHAKLISAKEAIPKREAALFSLLQNFMEEQASIIAQKIPKKSLHELYGFQDITPSEKNALSALLKETEILKDDPTFKARYENNPAFKQLKAMVDAVLEQKAALENKEMSMSEKLEVIDRTAAKVDSDIATFKTEAAAVKALTEECGAYEDSLGDALRPVMEKAASELAKRIEKMEATLASEKKAFNDEFDARDDDYSNTTKEAKIKNLESTLKTLRATLEEVTALNLRYANAAEYVVALNADSGLNLDKATREGFINKITTVLELKQSLSPNSLKTNAEKLVAFNETFKTAEKTLSQNLDSATKKFLSAVLMILKTVASLGIYAAVRAHQSKKETGTAKFWKTPEQIATTKIKRTIERGPEEEPPTKKPKR